MARGAAAASHAHRRGTGSDETDCYGRAVADEFEPVDEETTEGHAPGRLTRAGEAVRGIAIDTTPLRESRDFRLLWVGELISTTGRQVTLVALPAQIFLLTGSSLAVGIIGLVQIVPLAVFSLVGGAWADRMDRRKLIIATEVGLALSTAMLLVGTLINFTPLWYLYLAAGLQAGFGGVNSPTRSAVVPNVVPRERLPAALALNQVMFNTTMIVGPAVAGFIIGVGTQSPHSLGLILAYSTDLLTFATAIAAAIMLRPQMPRGAGTEASTSAWRSIREGFSFVKGRRVLIATFVIDLNAMIFGMPRALFPALAYDVFGVGAHGLGLLYAAPAAGALIGALTAGWVGRVRHQGRAVVWSVMLWGASIAAFGFCRNAFWLGLFFLAIAGGADVISAVFRSTILQLSVPDALRGRLSAIHILVVTGGPRLGDFEAGLVAGLTTTEFSVVSGGLACIAGAALTVLWIPELWRYHAGDTKDRTEPGRPRRWPRRAPPAA